MARSNEVDFELIAALIDGRLSGEERERAVRLISESEQAFDVYSDALRARNDLSGADVVPIDIAQKRPRALPWRTIGSAAVAAALLIAVIPLVQVRRDRALVSSESAVLLQPVVQAPAIRTIVADASEGRGWSVTRGASDQFVDSTIAFRLGVRAVDLQLALTQRETTAADRIAAEIVEMLDAVELADAVKASYVAVRAGLARGDAPAQLAASASRAEQAIDDLMPVFPFYFGRWVAAGDAAAGVRSNEFFRNARTERFLETAAETGDLSASDAESLQQIADLVAQGVTEEEFATIREHFRELIRRHGG